MISIAVNILKIMSSIWYNFPTFFVRIFISLNYEHDFL